MTTQLSSIPVYTDTMLSRETHIEPRTHVECCVVHVEEGHLGLVLPADEDVRICPDVAPVEEPGQAQAYEARAPTQWDVRPKYIG